MPTSGSHVPDGDNPPDSASHPSMQSVTDSGMPMHMFPLPTASTSNTSRSKRKQVKNACTNCQKACKKCDECRPCLRCVKYGHPDQCVDSQRKERKKGVKRGKYKRRDGKGNSVETIDGPFVSGVPLATSGQSPSANSPLPGETYTNPMFCTDYYPIQEAASSAHSGDNHQYASHQMQGNEQRLYSTVAPYPPMLQYPPPQLPYLSHTRPEALIHTSQPTQFYSSPPYAKTSTAGPQERTVDFNNTPAYR
ncbi:hypothetical protein VKT23_003977 [Stygiomarasmius scandens]|uniref:Zn(2)-C6 fungal-type domain-containing protein n=1 Tax=Marasmiellus scandens TaxID=2682957 RepID=A0ABR1JUN2_9AGAR